MCLCDTGTHTSFRMLCYSQPWVIMRSLYSWFADLCHFPEKMVILFGDFAGFSQLVIEDYRAFQETFSSLKRGIWK